MIPAARGFRVFAYPAPCDLRAGLDRLTEIAEQHLGAKREELVGSYFLFVNEHRTRAKVLHYDGTGWCLYWKRLDSGHRFAQLWRDDADRDKPGRRLSLTWAEVLKFLHRPKRIVPRPAAAPSERRTAAA